LLDKKNFHFSCDYGIFKVQFTLIFD